MTEQPKSDQIATAAKMSGFINPLKFLAVEALGSPPPHNPALDGTAVLRDITYPEYIPDDLKTLHERYDEISHEETAGRGLFLAPMDQVLLEKLVWPLRQAKASYVLGNHLGTIALCGLVAEMTTILVFELNQSSKVSAPAFEKLSQHARITFLSGKAIKVAGKDVQDTRIIDDDLKRCLDGIRNLRKKYLHYLSQDHTPLSVDARRIYGETVATVVAVLGQEIKDGQLVVNPQLLDYLKEKGILK